jgi:hypothetical protein
MAYPGGTQQNHWLTYECRDSRGLRQRRNLSLWLRTGTVSDGGRGCHWSARRSGKRSLTVCYADKPDTERDRLQSR